MPAPRVQVPACPHVVPGRLAGVRPAPRRPGHRATWAAHWCRRDPGCGQVSPPLPLVGQRPPFARGIVPGVPTPHATHQHHVPPATTAPSARRRPAPPPSHTRRPASGGRDARCLAGLPDTVSFCYLGAAAPPPPLPRLSLSQPSGHLVEPCEGGRGRGKFRHTLPTPCSSASHPRPPSRRPPQQGCDGDRHFVCRGAAPPHSSTFSS